MIEMVVSLMHIKGLGLYSICAGIPVEPSSGLPMPQRNVIATTSSFVITTQKWAVIKFLQDFEAWGALSRAPQDSLHLLTLQGKPLEPHQQLDHFNSVSAIPSLCPLKG